MDEARIEFKIGTKFYYDNHLIEVVENKKIPKNGKLKYSYDCDSCFFNNRAIEVHDYGIDYCEIIRCGDFKRHDKKKIIFKEIKEWK